MNKLYYKLLYLDFRKGIIRLITSNIIKNNETIVGYIGPSYEQVPECYQYKYLCKGNSRNILYCYINKKEPNKVEFEGKYKIYSLENYSFNSFEVYKKLNYFEKGSKEKKSIIFALLFILLSIFKKIKQKKEISIELKKQRF